MTDVVGVVFHKGGRVYYFDPASIELARGDQVVVQTMRGTEIGEVVDAPHEIDNGGLPAPLKRVVRKATPTDLDMLEANVELRREALRACRRLIDEHRLDMKLVDAEIVFGGGKISFSFYSEERVDFRALVADLAKELKVRIELRQIGAREEARVVGGLGPCGRHLCCTLWQGDQEPVSIRMAKEQNLPLNPMKISGLCGRLMCCLKYEQEQYVCFRKEAPSRGTQVQSSEGQGVVIGFQVPKDSLTLRMEDGSIADVPIDDCSCGGTPCRKSTAPTVPVVVLDLPESDEVPAPPGIEGVDAGTGPDLSESRPTDHVEAASCPPVPAPREPDLVFEGQDKAEVEPEVGPAGEIEGPEAAPEAVGEPKRTGRSRRSRGRGRRRGPRPDAGAGESGS